MTATPSASVSAPLTILLFGPMQVWVHGRPLPHLRSRKAVWLLALLALRHGRPVEREWLAATLWPDTHQSQASTYLSVILSELRHALGDQRGRLQSPSRHALSLDLAGADIDVVTFDVALVSKKPEALKQAVTLYRGPLLKDCAEEWVYQERNTREQECLRALQTLGDAALAAGDYSAAIDYYQRAVSLDPWSEVARRGWMEALAKSGDRNAALQVYREFAEWLRSDPSAVPDEETSALYARLRAEARPRPGLLPVVTGEESVDNAVAPVITKGYLPHPLTDLIGREKESIEVAARLRGARLVTLTGSGGIGKTRLAIEVASECSQDVAAYPDGVWLVTLEALSAGGMVVAQVASVLGLREEAGRSLLEDLIDHLRAKRLLLVLDNCEHLLEACVDVSALLLRECARVRILATSREALGITGENAWQVPALPIPDPAHLPPDTATLLQVLAGYESVQLFVERAQAVQKGFALAGSNAAAVAQVCSQMEGIPLAIELAAARVKAMTVEQIATRLNDHLSLLTGGNHAAQLRQQTLRATLDWSYALLSEAERLLLRRVSVFAGGWTLEAAEEVCIGEGIEAWQVLDLLTSLVDKSLIVFEERGRYRLLETVRQYASECLKASDEMQSVKARQRNWCLVLAAEADLHLEGGIEQVGAMQRLEAEHENLRVALAWSATEAPPDEADLRLTGCLWRYWHIRGHNSEGRKYLNWALTRGIAPTATLERAKALNGAGFLALNQSDFISAETLLEESLRICKEMGDKRGIALASVGLGGIARNQGDLRTTWARFEESLGLHRELGNRHGIANVLAKLGEMAFDQSDLAGARTYLEESLGLCRELGDKNGSANVLFIVGNIATMQGDYVLAKTQLEESLFLHRELGNKYGIAQVLNNLGNATSLQGNLATAQAQREESLGMQRELGNKRGVAYTLMNLGATAIMQGNYAQAKTQLEEGLNLCRELDNKLGVASALINLGDVVSRQGDFTTGRIQLEEGLHLYRELNYKIGVAYALCYLGRVISRQGDLAAGRTQFEEGLRLFRELDNKRGVAIALENLAGALSAETEGIQAARLLGASQGLRKNINAPLPPSEHELLIPQIAQIRAVLGPVAFKDAWEKGSEMTWEQAVTYALE